MTSVPLTYADSVALEDFHKQLSVPFPASRVMWKAQSWTPDRQQALMVAYIDARTVMERLDEVCPGQWSFQVKLYPGSPVVARGKLTIAGVTRSDVGESGEGEAAGAKAATSDAFKRCAVHFGVGRYLYDLPRVWTDWDENRRQPVQPIVLPTWALPAGEQASGVSHVLSSMQALREQLPNDVERLREVYRHLKAALDAAGVS